MVISKLYPWLPRIYIVLLAFLISDLLILVARMYLDFEPAPLPSVSSRALQIPGEKPLTAIVGRNIFSLDGTVPPSLFQTKGKGDAESDASPDNVPVPSGLPINLIGTIVHSDPSRSIANVELKTKNISLAVRVGKTIDKIAKLERVERGKIIIRNLGSNRLEFIEMKDQSKLSFKSAPDSQANIKQVSPNQFEVARSDIQRYTQDLGSLLQQAATIPERGPGGEIIGFRLLGIQPDSVFNQLGLKVGDVIKGVNGERIDSPTKAFEMYNALINSSEIRLMIEREGQDSEIEYRIK
ncbi:MAG: general secretion pathway protein GspC [Bdellovibrionaceae bacterium]|nr:general secretion pathway protein GspC [Pseudobdellovibrionaceae bacterium]MDW8189636.1 type II secretion system protein GspC [Pseudobdellovibrionaceae bacterium]